MVELEEEEKVDAFIILPLYSNQSDGKAQPNFSSPTIFPKETAWSRCRALILH